MQVRHQPLFRGNRLHQCLVHLDRIDRADSQAGQVGDQLENTHHQIAQTRRGRQVGAPGRQIDAGQHHLVIATVHQSLDLVHHDTGRDRPRIAATVGNDAEGTAVVTAVLDLHIGAATGAKAVDQVAGGFGHRHDVINLHRLGAKVAC